MSQKKTSKSGKKQRNRKGPAHKPGNPRHGSAVSLGAFRAEKLLAPMTPGFVQWFERSGGEAAEALACLKVIGVVLTEFLQVDAVPSITAFTTDEAVRAFDALEAVLGEDTDMAADAFHLYIDFLGEMGLWTGTDQDYDAVHDFVDEEAQFPVPEFPEIMVPRIPEAEELAAFEAMPLISQVGALLEWIGTGKKVTSTGVLRLSDIEAAAASLGVKARGQRQGKQRSDAPALPGFESLEVKDAEETTLVVRSMNDVPELEMMWRCLQEAELIEVGSTKAVPRQGHGFEADSTPARRVETYRKTATSILQRFEDEIRDAGPLGTPIGMLRRAVLTMGCTETPMPMEKFELDEDLDPDGEEYLTNLLANASLGMFTVLEELGLLSLDTHVRVPKHLWGSLKTVFEKSSDDYGEFYGLPGGGEEQQIELRRNTTPAKSTTVLELRIALRDLTPPIWRTVLVPNGARLSHLHYIIQSAFGWDGGHLHEFQAGGRNGTTYSSGDFEASPYTDKNVEERTVALSDVFKRKGSKLEYTYDFGDNWRHLITLENILPLKDAGAVPRCLDGARMAPEDDCGGIWGWLELLEAIKDPAHPAHEDRMDWMGLEEGETLDPEKFDIKAINKRLRQFQDLLG